MKLKRGRGGDQEQRQPKRRQLGPGVYKVDCSSKTGAPAWPASGAEAVGYLLHGVASQRFFDKCWERRCLLVRGRAACSAAYAELFSTPQLLEVAREHRLQSGLNLDIVSYDGKKRTTHSRPAAAEKGPRVTVEALREALGRQGRSVRLLHPQRWCGRLAELLALLETHFGSCVGCNAYLTPPQAQGFAPHYDDIDAFVLQLEGEKEWKLYESRDVSEQLPLASSRDFRPGELGAPTRLVLRPGDLLYMPRGTIHEARTRGGTPSLHLTISCCQGMSYGTALQEALSRAVELAVESERELRQSLPLGHERHLGIVHQGAASPARAELLAKLAGMAQLVVKHLEGPLDALVDGMQCDFQVQRLRPPLPPGGLVPGAAAPPLDMFDTVRLAWPGAARLQLCEEDTLNLQHCLHNAREEHAAGEGQADYSRVMDFPSTCGPCLEMLLACEEPLCLRALPAVEAHDPRGRFADDVFTALGVAQSLLKEGIIVRC